MTDFDGNCNSNRFARCRASPELVALLAVQRRHPPSLYQLRMLDMAVREAARASGREDRRRRAAEAYDPTAAANNARRLQAIQKQAEQRPVAGGQPKGQDARPVAGGQPKGQQSPVAGGQAKGLHR